MLTQHAAICVRRDADMNRVLLVTSLDTGRWIPPKGHPEPGMSGGDVALSEAMEEAGIVGRVTASLGSYDTIKRKRSGKVLPCLMHAWLVEVDEVLTDFPEMGRRRIAWLSPEEAASRVTEPGLRNIFLSLEKECPRPC